MILETADSSTNLGKLSRAQKNKEKGTFSRPENEWNTWERKRNGISLNKEGYVSLVQWEQLGKYNHKGWTSITGEKARSKRGTRRKLRPGTRSASWIKLHAIIFPSWWDRKYQQGNISMVRENLGKYLGGKIKFESVFHMLTTTKVQFY